MERQKNRFGVPLVLLAGVLWGTVGPAQLLAGAAAGPAALGGARILVGGLVLAAVVLATDAGSFRLLTGRAWPAVLAASAATATFQAAFMTSVATTGAAVATALTFGVAPVATGICERAATGTRLTRRWVAGTGCAVIGCVLVVAPAEGVRVDLGGAALGVLAGACFGVYTVSAKRLIQHGVPMPAAVAVTLLVGGAVLAPWTLAALPALTTPRGLALVVWLGPVTAAAAYWFFVTGLRRVSAATAGTLSLVEPLVAAALAVLLLGERLSAPVTAGAVLLLGGLVVVSWPRVRNGADTSSIRNEVVGRCESNSHVA
ncbi:DMT family transporter [Pseudonocardia sp. MH-G8]|uniref:DMT family transporter n=1 Tax=Pseudonocardia sp. MH-G8 TaxID=1854588 RepID=UPI001E318EF1|nr:EamA family transporter [Pseudonocardia sp. MH-G8]